MQRLALRVQSRCLGFLPGGLAAVPAVLYPLWLAVTARRRPARMPPQVGNWPGLSVIIAAYRESEVIAAKVADTTENGYPGDLQVIVVADDAGTAAAARTTGAEVLEPGERLGKAEAINRGAAAATEPVIVVTDADARLRPGSLRALARWFDDPTVGVVTGEKQETDGGQGLYWRFESHVKRWESRRGTTIGVIGELTAVRRSLYRAIPRDVAVDDLWMGLDVIESGHASVYEPEAVALEKPSPTLAAEWERRTRTNAGLMDLLWRRRKLLVPGRSPVAGELWGHKLMRSLVGPAAHLLLIVQALGRAWHSRLAILFLVGHALGIRGLRNQASGRPSSRFESAAGQVIFLQATAFGGVVRYLRGDRPALWPKPERATRAGEVFGTGSGGGDDPVPT